LGVTSIGLQAIEDGANTTIYLGATADKSKFNFSNCTVFDYGAWSYDGSVPKKNQQISGGAVA